MYNFRFIYRTHNKRHVNLNFFKAHFCSSLSPKRIIFHKPFYNRRDIRTRSKIQNSSMGYFSTYACSSKENQTGGHGGGGFNFLLEAFGSSVILSMIGTLGYTIYKVHYEPREREIMGNIISDENWEQKHSLRGDAKKISHGSLTHSKIGLNDKIWLKKGAKGVSELVRELVIGTALHELNPQVQPETLILVEPCKIEPSRGRFYTLSEMKPKSMDLQDFITQEDWEKKLRQKPMKGLEVALAKVGLMAGQQDCKYANLVITDLGTHYEVAAIDFELSGKRFFSINSRVLTLDLLRLAGFVRDLHSEDSPFFGGFILGLMGDERACDFMDYALKHQMNKDNVLEFYRTVADTDFISPAITRLKELEQRSDIVCSRHVRAWERELKSWKRAAKEFVDDYDEKHRGTPTLNYR